MTTKHLILLRGINVGGHHKLAMKDLLALARNLGAENPRTYIQSGNLIFESNSKGARELALGLAPAIVKQFGFDVPVIHRSASEFFKAFQANPFYEEGADPKSLHCCFLKSKPSAAALKTLDPQRSSPDEFQVLGKEIFLRCPEGLAKTKLSNLYFESRLKTVSSSRNWNTMNKIAELLR